MPSHLSGALRELAVEIIRCPVLAQCAAEGPDTLPCHEVAAGPGGPHRARWVPEPWVGHLTEAPLLFVASNPGGGGSPITDPEDLSCDSPDQALLDWADGAFDEGQVPGVADGVYLVNARGSAAGGCPTGAGPLDAPGRSCPNPCSQGWDTPSPRWSTAAARVRKGFGPRLKPAPPDTWSGCWRPRPLESWSWLDRRPNSPSQTTCAWMSQTTSWVPSRWGGGAASWSFSATPTAGAV